MLIFVSIWKLVTAPGTYPASDPRSNPANWVLFAIFVGGGGFPSLATAVSEPLRRASMGISGSEPSQTSRAALALSALVAAAGLSVLGIAFDLPLLVLIGVGSAILSVVCPLLRKG
jgi:hypothetical protein